MALLTDELFMREALKQARLAFQRDEVPIGAVIVSEGMIIAKAHNQVEQLCDVTAHAEMLAITAASHYLGSKYLHGCTLYVTLEPCPMCAGALRWAQIDRIVYATDDPKGGFMHFGKAMLHPTTEISSGLCQEESRALLKHFFQSKRL